MLRVMASLATRGAKAVEKCDMRVHKCVGGVLLTDMADWLIDAGFLATMVNAIGRREAASAADLRQKGNGRGNGEIGPVGVV